MTLSYHLTHDWTDRPSPNWFSFYSLDELVDLALGWLSPKVAPRTRGELVEMLNRAACCNRATETDDEHARHKGTPVDYEGFAWAIQKAEKGGKVFVALNERHYWFAVAT